jgi:hypothetical protein
MKHEKSLPFSQKIGIASLITLIIAICAIWVFNALRANAPGRAEEIVRPIDIALIAAGAVRKCETIANGYHIASRAVGSTSSYEIKKNREETKELVYKIAKENGFNLIQYTPEIRPDIFGGMNDETLSNWVFDNKTRTSTFEDLEEGKIALSAGFETNTNEEFYCNGHPNGPTKLYADQNQTVITLKTDLPNLRSEYRN